MMLIPDEDHYAANLNSDLDGWLVLGPSGGVLSEVRRSGLFTYRFRDAYCDVGIEVAEIHACPAAWMRHPPGRRVGSNAATWNISQIAISFSLQWCCLTQIEVSGSELAHGSQVTSALLCMMRWLRRTTSFCHRRL